MNWNPNQPPFPPQPQQWPTAFGPPAPQQQSQGPVNAAGMIDWSKTASIQPDDRLPWFEAGFDGDVKTIRTGSFKSQDGTMYWAVELEVITSNHPTHPVGFKGRWSQRMTGLKGDDPWKAVTGWAIACVGEEPWFDQSQLPMMIKAAETNPTGPVNLNPFIDRITHLVTFYKPGATPNPKTGKPFCHHRFSKATGTAGVPVTAPVGPPVAMMAPPSFQSPAPPAPLQQAPWAPGAPAAAPWGNGGPPPWQK